MIALRVDEETHVWVEISRGFADWAHLCYPGWRGLATSLPIVTWDRKLTVLIPTRSIVIIAGHID